MLEVKPSGLWRRGERTHPRRRSRSSTSSSATSNWRSQRWSHCTASRLLHEALLITEECCDKWQIRAEDIPLLVVQLQPASRLWGVCRTEMLHMVLPQLKQPNINPPPSPGRPSAQSACHSAASRPGQLRGGCCCRRARQLPSSRPMAPAAASPKSLRRGWAGCRAPGRRTPAGLARTTPGSAHMTNCTSASVVWP